MIKNIIFDLGGVIMTIDQEEAVRRFKEIGLQDAERWLDPYTQVGFFGDVECGKITAEEFRIKLSEVIGRELTFDECKYAWLGYRKSVPAYKLEALVDLRNKGYRLILLSNTNPYMMSWAQSPEFDGKGNSLDSYFDASYKSYELKAMKPDTAFFKAVIEGEKIVPQESVFIDDGPRNIEAGRGVGFHCICPENGADWRSELNELLATIG